MDRKTSECKATVDADGLFRGKASTYGGPPDSYGDVILPGAFTKTIRENGGRIKVLNQHNPADVIGMATLIDKADGLWVEGKLELELTSAKEAYIRLRNSLIDGISIGFN